MEGQSRFLGTQAKIRNCQHFLFYPGSLCIPHSFYILVFYRQPDRIHSLLLLRRDIPVALMLLQYISPCCRPPAGLEVVLHFPTPLTPSSTTAGLASLTAFYCSLEVQQLAEDSLDLDQFLETARLSSICLTRLTEDGHLKRGTARQWKVSWIPWI